MEQTRDIDVNGPKPSWLELPDEEKQKHTYWGCAGEYVTPEPPKRRWWKRVTSQPSSVPSDDWAVIFHSKEEAEAHASVRKGSWVWDGKPAKPYTLDQAMLIVRRQGRAGIACVGWDGIAWRTLKRWPAHIPLQGEI